MAMSKRFFRRLAKDMHEAMPEGGPELAVWNRIIEALADAIASEPSNFQRGLFLHACRQGLPAPRSRAKTPA